MRKLFPVAIKLALAAMFILIPIGICFALDPSATIHAVQGHMSMPALVAAGAVVPALAAAGVLRPRAVPIKEACRLLGYKARSEVYILVKEGVLDAFKDGTKTLIEEVTRFSARKLQEAALQATQLPVYQKLLNHVLVKNILQLADGAPGATATTGVAPEQSSPAILPQAGSSQPLPAAA